MLLRIITSTAISKCFCVDTQYYPCHRGRYLQFFDMYHNYLGFREFAKYGEWSKFCPLTRGSALDLAWGGSAPDPRYMLALCMRAMRVRPHFLTWRRPCYYSKRVESAISLYPSLCIEVVIGFIFNILINCLLNSRETVLQLRSVSVKLAIFPLDLVFQARPCPYNNNNNNRKISSDQFLIQI